MRQPHPGKGGQSRRGGGGCAAAREGVVLPEGETIEYTYDPLGRRIERKVNGATTDKYLWTGQTTLLAVYDGGNGLKYRFEYADKRLPVSMTTCGGLRYYLAYDQAGSLRLVIDADGEVQKRVDYDTFGYVTADSNPTLDAPFGFAGGLYDPETRLCRFGARDYDPATGRFTAKDPILFNGGDTNLYGYCLNDPINGFDPDGLKWIKHGPHWYDWHYEYSDWERETLRKKAESMGQACTDLLVRTPSDPILFYFQYTSPYEEFKWPWEMTSEDLYKPYLPDYPGPAGNPGGGDQPHFIP